MYSGPGQRKISCFAVITARASKITIITIHNMDELTNREKCQGLEKVEIVVEISAKTTLKK